MNLFGFLSLKRTTSPLIACSGDEFDEGNGKKKRFFFLVWDATIEIDIFRMRSSERKSLETVQHMGQVNCMRIIKIEPMANEKASQN